MSCTCIPPRCWGPHKRQTDCIGPYPPVPTSDQPPLFYQIPGIGGFFILQNGSTGGVSVDGGILPSVLNVPNVAYIPGKNPPCCQNGSTVEIIGFVSDGGGVPAPTEFGVALQLESTEPIIYSLNIGVGAPPPPLVFVRTHWVFFRYCTCGQLPLFAALAIYPTTAGTEPSRDPAYLQALGLTFTRCP